jgi:hypothetical protein
MTAFVNNEVERMRKEVGAAYFTTPIQQPPADIEESRKIFRIAGFRGKLSIRG